MIAVVECNDLCSPGKALSQLHSTFSSFGAAVGKIHAIKGGWQQLSKQLRIRNLWALDKLAIYDQVHIGGYLLLYGCYYFGMAMTNISYTKAGDEINICFVVNIILVN